MEDGLLFPWPELNQLVKIDPGVLTIIGAATSHGKTTFLLNLMNWWAKQDNGAIILWSGEMTDHILWAKLVGIESGIPFRKVVEYYQSQLYPAEFQEAREKLKTLAEKIYIVDEPMTAVKFSHECQEVAGQKKIAAVIVDYLQQMLPDNKHYRTREEEVSLTAQELRALAQKIKAPVIASCQLNRQNSMYSEKPQLTHFRESGRIEQEAHLAIGLWNSRMARAEAGEILQPQDRWYWAEDLQATAAAMAIANTWGRDLLEVDILKSRLWGNVGKAVPLMLDGATGKISSLPDKPGDCLPAVKIIRRTKRGQ